MSTKERVTVSVDPALLHEAAEAVAAGGAESLSAWVSEAMAEKLEHRRKLLALAEAIADFEAEFGEITREEIDAQLRADEQNAIKVRASPRSRAERAARRAKRVAG